MKTMENTNCETSSRLKLIIKGSDQEDILVSRRKITDFKDWLDK